MEEPVRIIYVDLDRGLLHNNLLEERLLLALLRNPLMLFQALGWILRGGRARLKMEIARRTLLDVSHLPYNENLVSFLRDERQAGQTLVLASGAPFEWAHAVSLHLNLFDRVLATDGKHGNLKGLTKLALIEQDCEGKPFGYAGGVASNREIFEASHLPIVVGGPITLTAAHEERMVRIPQAVGGAKAWWQALHPHQWSKNLLLFVPAIAAHRLHQIWPHALLAFFSFSFVASACYLLNDFCDIDEDRKHPDQRSNALASGILAPIPAQLLGASLLLAATILALLLPMAFGLDLICYGVVSVLYSTRLKDIVVVDVLMLTFLYLLRILAGEAACRLDLSLWLVSFIFFLGLSLAELKRHGELTRQIKDGIGWAERPSYKKEDRPLLMKTGLCAGLAAVLVLALYTASPHAEAVYKTPSLLLLDCGLLFYWVERLWRSARREAITGDPTRYILKDRMSYLIVLGAAVVAGLARYL
jgi:4-hydroxybenzoate polyprenyltransferase